MNILIVDDEPSNLKLLRAQLEAEGHVVTEAHDGIEALEMLHQGQADAIISDILMPRMDGYRLCYEVRKAREFRHLPFITYSASYTSPGDEKLAMDLGADKYLRKPCSVAVLAAALDEVAHLPPGRHDRLEGSIPESELMREYNERLVKKLESKNTELEGVVDRLQQSEERLRTILRAEPECVKIISPEGELLEMNPAGLAMLGAETLEQVRSRSLLNFLEPRDREAFMQLHERVMSGESGMLEFEVIGLNGNRRWLETHAAPLRDKQGRIISLLGVTRDITERKRADATIKEHERKLSILLDNLPGVAYRCLNDANYTAELMSDGVAELTGYAAQEFRQHRRHFGQLIHPGDRDRIRGEIQAALERKQPFELMYRIVTATGAERWVWEKGQAVPTEKDQLQALEGFITDITARRFAEERVRESEERFRQLAENVNEVFWITDPDRTEVAYVSPAYENIWGRSCESLYASAGTWLDAIHPEDRPRVTDAVANQILGSYDETYRIVKPDESIRWIRDRAFPVRNAAGKVYRVVGTATDITDARTMEEQFRQAQKMEAVGRLSGGVAHDFNNILCVILGHTSLLQDGELSAEGRAVSLQQITDAAERAANLTRQLLAFSRRQVMQSRPLDLNDVIANITKMLQMLIGESIALRTRYASGGARVHADPVMMEQVLFNLAVNARDAMPEGGEISIQTARVQRDGDGSRRGLNQPSGEFIRLSIRDTGCGIPEDVLPRVFEPFFTTKETGKGTGLGLATVFGIVEQHQGWVEVESKVGSGTTFLIFLPLEDTASVGTNRESSAGVRGGHENILVVEDEPSIRVLTRELLERYGYHVYEASNGPAALELWTQEGGNMHLLLTDVIMPGKMSGPDLAVRLQKADPGLKVVYTSGYPGEIAGHDLSLSEGVNFLQKPYLPVKLAEIIRNALDAK